MWLGLCKLEEFILPLGGVATQEGNLVKIDGVLFAQVSSVKSLDLAIDQDNISFDELALLINTTFKSLHFLLRRVRPSRSFTN